MSTTITLATDGQSWALDNIAGQLVKWLSDEFSFLIEPHHRIASGHSDLIVSMWWPAGPRLRAARKTKALVTCVFDHLSWSINDETKHTMLLVLRNTEVLAACNRGLLEELKTAFPEETARMECLLIEDGVDTELFSEAPLPQKFSAGWVGNSSRMTPGGPPDQKGLELFREAARLAGVKGKVLDASGGHAWPHERMPLFYKDVSAIVCSSYREGTPNPILEGMSCGRPAISTRVGIVDQIITPASGIILPDRSAGCLAEALRALADKSTPVLQEMGRQARVAALRHCWECKVKAWRTVLRLGLRAGAARARPAPVPIAAVEELEPEKVLVAPAIAVATVKPARKPAQPVKPPKPAAPRRVIAPGEKPRVLLVSDVPGWAFHVNLLGLEKYLKDKYEFTHWFVIDLYNGKPAPKMDDFDVVFLPYHRWPISGIVPWDRALGSLRSQSLFPERNMPIGEEEYILINRFRGFHVVTQESYKQFKSHCPGVVYLTNPVDMDRFPEPAPQMNRLIASWNGNASHSTGHGDVKGFNTIIKQACTTAAVELVYAEYNTCRLSFEEMPAFYQRGNVAICMSKYEGASNSLLEGMAAGQAVISTPVGNIVEIRDYQLEHFSETGIILVNRNADNLVTELSKLKASPEKIWKMGQVNRAEIAARWSWRHWASRYDEFLKMGLT
jgi:glycosyltransferase involved in cell wall biosynthesis